MQRESSSLGTIDCSYHVMWIALSQAISDYGIKEVNAALDTLVAPEPEGPTVNGEAGALGSPDVHQIPVIGDEVKEIPSEHLPLLDVERSVATEALNSSTRIAGLVSYSPYGCSHADLSSRNLIYQHVDVRH